MKASRYIIGLALLMPLPLNEISEYKTDIQYGQMRALSGEMSTADFFMYNKDFNASSVKNPPPPPPKE